MDPDLENVNLHGYKVWKRVLRAVEELRDVKPGTRVH